MLMRPRGLITGAIMLCVENGSKEVNAIPRPAILPFVWEVFGRGVREGEGFAF